MTTSTAAARGNVSQTVTGDISPPSFDGMIEHFRAHGVSGRDVERDAPRAHQGGDPGERSASAAPSRWVLLVRPPLA
jgi:hypothetical protein